MIKTATVAGIETGTAGAETDRTTERAGAGIDRMTEIVVGVAAAAAAGRNRGGGSVPPASDRPRTVVVEQMYRQPADYSR